MLDYYVHGWLMFICWGVFAAFQIISNRYLKGTLSPYHMYFHVTIGLISLILTLWFSIWAWVTMTYIYGNTHAYFVYPVLFLVIFLSFTGIFARANLAKSVWNT